MSSLLDHLYEPERHCVCGHHEGSHCHGFSNQACMWCECRAFEDPDREPASPHAATPTARRRFFPAR